MAVADAPNRTVSPRRLHELRWTILLVSAVCVGILGLVALLVLTTDYPFSYFSRDPAIEVGESPVLGLLSYAGVLITWGGAVVAVFAGLLLAWGKNRRLARPLLLVGVGTAYLALDDLLLFGLAARLLEPVVEEVVAFLERLGVRRALPAPAAVDVEVREDAEEPGPEVRARLERPPVAKRARVRLLDEVFGLLAAGRQPPVGCSARRPRRG